jgi:hypothetical protein
MGWREKMGMKQEVEHFKLYPQKEQKEQKAIENTETGTNGYVFATIATIATMNQKIETPQQQIDFPCQERTKTKQNSCPARCKTSGKCYGKAYFEAKPGKAIECIIDQCPWDNRKKSLPKSTNPGQAQ